MFKRVFYAVAALLALISIGLPSVQARDLTFGERVEAQKAIERVYYSHQIGTTKTFEEAIPRAVIEAKVRKYLKQSAALEDYWSTSIAAEMLEREMERMAGGTRMPERLREIFAALDNDAFLIQECLARATLADRLVRNFYAFDSRFHTEARREAEALREALAGGMMDPWQDHPRRSEVELVPGQRDEQSEQELELNAEPRFEDASDNPNRLRLSPSEFDSWRNRLPDTPDGIPSVEDNREAFELRVLLEEDDKRMRFATYRFMKTPWDEWWQVASEELDEAEVVAVAPLKASLPDEIGEPYRASWNPNRLDEEDARTAGSLPDTDYSDEDAWDNGSLDGLPDRRRYHTAIWTGSVMMIWGGYSDGMPLNTGGRYDPATDTWAAISTAGAPSARYYHTAVWADGLMVVWGGYGGSGSYLNTGGRYDPATDTWTATSTVGAPSARYRHTAVWTGSRMVVWGGNGIPPIYYLDSGGLYDPATDTWIATSTDGAPSTRYRHTAVWTGSLMVVWGGYGGGSYFNTGGRYDPVSDTWTATSTAGAPSVRNNHTATWTGNRMVVWGGISNGVPVDTGGRYDPASNTWTATSTAGAPRARNGHTAVWTGNRMVVWGGRGSYAPYHLDSGGQYDPATNTWMATSTVGAPLARYYHTAVWTGDLMVVWGGDGYYHPKHLDTGGRYDPTTDTWTATSSSGAPSHRARHTAVWTGNLMMVWGGYMYVSEGSENYLRTGARYDPALDTWTAVSTIDAPSVRTDHTAIWTGSRMVVWGGFGSGPYYTRHRNTGGQYDPTTDTWTSTSTVGAPSGRESHTAIWAGNRMIVWGGWGAYPPYRLNSGGQYDPETDTWSATLTTDAPSARAYHTAIWTGSRMVVWGGYGISHPYYLNTGGLYNPATDTWTPTSITDAPSARAYHTAIWTGSRMVVWGGGDDFASVNAGGLYDPAADTWTATSTAGAPSARYSHTATWTGNLMVVWGGVEGEDYLNTGGRYDPATDNWMVVTTSGAPSARAGHTAVWTGSWVVVWGGFGGPIPYYLNSGGRYYPGDYNSAPVAEAGEYPPLECTHDGQAVARLDGSGSTDPDSTPGTNDDILSFDWYENFGEPSEDYLGSSEIIEVSMSLGSHLITLLVTDSSGMTDTDETMQIVVDTTPPVLEVPDDLTIECAGIDGTAVDFGTATASDACCGEATITHDAPALFPLGETIVTWVATDCYDNVASLPQTIAVVDTTPPDISVDVEPDFLWPPNHRMVDIAASVEANDICSIPTVALESILSDEPDDAPGIGDGETVNDIQDAEYATADFNFKLRAERAGSGGGRIYTVTYSATDPSNNATLASAIVFVPHSMSPREQPESVGQSDEGTQDFSFSGSADTEVAVSPRGETHGVRDPEQRRQRPSAGWDARRPESSERAAAQDSSVDEQTSRRAESASERVSRHLDALTSDTTPEAVRRDSIHALLNILSEDEELETRLPIVRGLIGKIDISLNELLVEHLESIKEEAVEQSREDIERQAVQLLNDLEADEE